MDLIAGSRFGGYQVISLIGKGGMGRVYAAEDLRLHRKVAIKILPGESTQQLNRLQRFEQEARAASALNHPNILTIYEIGEIDGIHYMATELVEGETLRELSRRRLPIKKILDISVQACGALAAAHAARIVHRDIKPENIMLRADGYIKVLDFGLAKLIEPQFGPSSDDVDMATAMTQAGQILGTWLYMSPEQVRGKDVDARTDIWSLGTVIYELTAGRPPFGAATATDMIVSIVDRDPARLSEFGEVPEELDRILAKALTKDREERYQSIKDMGLDLKQLQQSLEIESASRVSRMQTTVAASSNMRREAMDRIDASRKRANGGIEDLAADSAQSFKKTSGNKVLIALALGLIILASVGWKLWTSSRKQQAIMPTAERQLTYSLLVQKMRDGKAYQDPFPSTGREIFENGWKFRFNLFSSQSGSLYLLDEGPGADGRTVLTVLFPTPSNHNGVAQLTANETVQTGWYVFDQHQGTEKFWIVWAAQPIRDLELTERAVTNAQDQGVIRDANQSVRIQDLLSHYSSEQATMTTDAALHQTTLQSRGDVLANMIELEHH
jgi:serine/threonine protein kinase